ncbi:MAG: hypothetical protein JNM63_05190 [Spirochaetia bacterium]|nr:hypothetical protein [Spirochaetia bacterium]
MKRERAKDLLKPRAALLGVLLLLTSCEVSKDTELMPFAVIPGGRGGEPAVATGVRELSIHLQIKNESGPAASFLVLGFSMRFENIPGKFFKRDDFRQGLKPGDLVDYELTLRENEFSGNHFADLESISLESIEVWDPQQDVSAPVLTLNYGGSLRPLWQKGGL